MGSKDDNICEDEKYEVIYEIESEKMMEKKPLISIVMPVYNAEKYLDEIFEGVIQQTYVNWELIVVDDNSNDSSREICEEFAKMDTRIKVIHLEKNGGAGNARNVGMSKARGEYLTFIDADDKIEQDLYESVVGKICEYSVDVVVWGLVEEYYNKKDKIVSKNTLIFPEKLCRNTKEVQKVVPLLEEKTLLGYQWNKVYRTKIIKENNIQFRQSVLYEDYFFNMDIMQYVENMYIMNQALYYYRKRFNDSITTKYIPEYYELSRERVKRMDEFCSQNNLEQKNVLRTLYLRYILSALMRNNDKCSKMSNIQQKKWIQRVKEDFLYQKLCLEGKVDSLLLKELQILINREQYGMCVVAGKMVYLVKNYVPLFFAIIKRKK